jgi:ABC-type microcin C transport system permease subunit YejE
MNKFFKFIIFIIIILQSLCAEFYLIYQENPPLAQAQIEDIEYCVLPDGIYKKHEYFEKVFDFSRKIQRAVIDNDIVFTDNASYLLTKTKIITKPKQNSFRKNTSGSK